MFNFLRKRFGQDFSKTPTEAALIEYGRAKPAGERPFAGSLQPEAAFTAAAPSHPDEAASSASEDQETPTAVLVCHGMGEQVRFETIGQVAASLLKQAATQGCTILPNGIGLSQQNDSLLARAELQWIKPNGKVHCVHIYEAYWAPVTEGKVTYWDTILFLLSAAWKGFTSSHLFHSCTFQRYLFGGLYSFNIRKGTKIALIVVLSFLLAQVGLIAVVLAKLANQLKAISAAEYAIKQTLLILLPGVHHLWPKPFFTAHHAWIAFKVFGWYLLVLEILLVRRFLVQYVGDVAAYISPYKSSKFDDIRTRIQAIGLNVAKTIYGFGNVTKVPEYQKVVMVGHSLGSVLAYDTLNAILNLDNTSATPGSRKVFARTAKLITFGSPLDKTAFLFRNQSNHVADPLREQMAAAFQPLIWDYALYRKLDFWTNLYSPRDIISGSLEYYDLPGVTPTRFFVENLPDPAATIYLYAHVQYWTGTLLAQTLYNAV